MARHEGKLEEIGQASDGTEAVFYAHGSESLRTALGKSKLHATQNCAALLGKNPSKTVIKDWWPNVEDWMRCRCCSAK